MDSTQDAEQAARPPPHIAERLQRRSNSRRRSSAQSSRRSSISSLHSRTSQLSSHGGPYSTHIAQHLRRASIIESRKARLAERAAHAEQVRLRAAAAKAVPRTSNSEEKALAAQAAREKLLAEITARCEEEVRRAKRIAEETREKKAAEHARLRDEIAGKFADAAKRRSHYQMNFRRPRTTSLAAVEEKKIEPKELRNLSQTAAAKVIQRAWRRSRPKRLALAFQKAGISLKELQNMEFEHVTKLISTEETMLVTLQLLNHLGMLGHETDESARRGATRVFLGAFMVVAHPVQAFSHAGKEPQEQDLISKGQNLVDAIENTASAMVAEQKLPYSTDQMQSLFQDFTSGFHAWKTQDLGILADVMVGSFVNLDLIIQTTKEDNDGGVAEEYLQAIRTEQTKILVRLKRLIGHDKAMDRIRRAVRKARRERAAQQVKESTDHIPRASTPVEMDIDLIPAASLLTPPATPGPESRSSLDAASLVNRLGLTMTVLPPNREIAHEIQINGIFEVQQQPWTDSRQHLMDVLRTGMRDSIQQGGIQAESAWTHAMVVLVKEKLMSLVTQRHPLHEKIASLLDADLIAQQVRQRVFVFDDFFISLGNIIKQICSRGRDEIIKEFMESTNSDTIDRLFQLINIVDLMTLDHINFQFRLASRSVLEHGHEHEHSMFEKDLENDVHTLDRTKAWWTAGRTAVGGPNNVAAAANAVYARALTDLVLSNSSMTYVSFPETLGLDFVRLLKLRARIFHVVAVASILLTSKIRMRRNRESLWTKEAERLMKLDLTTTDVDMIVRQIESGHMMPDSTRAGLSDFVSRVLPSAAGACRKIQLAEDERQQAIQGRRNYDPSRGQCEQEKSDVFTEQVASFILKSLREHIYSRLAASSTAEKARTMSATVQVLSRIGMPEFVEEVGKAVDVLERVRNVDLKAHEKWYTLVAEEAESQNL